MSFHPWRSFHPDGSRRQRPSTIAEASVSPAGCHPYSFIPPATHAPSPCPQASTVVELIVGLLGAGAGVQPDDIGVMATYRKQVGLGCLIGLAICLF